MSAKTYAGQDRGGAEAYSAYFLSMDKSMHQKIAYTTAHFPSTGIVADMGSGSGLGTYQLARLHPELKLVGVDINAVSIRLARDTYQSPNLEYREGDIAAELFVEGSVDGILDSSVFHHLTSFNGFDVNRVALALEMQAKQLRPGGVIIVRDFVIGRSPPMVHLDLPDDNGGAEGAPEDLSTAALFERFAREWRSSVNPDWPVPYRRMSPPSAGWARFKVAGRAAAEFILRKDYRTDWLVEVLEEYTYLSQQGFEELFQRLGLRVITSQEVWNPWIVENRFAGKARLETLDGRRLPFPPTNYVIVGKKTAPGHGTRLRDAIPRTLSKPSFLTLESFERVEPAQRMELASRPNRTVDLVPWFRSNGSLWVVARQDFPRPVLNAHIKTACLSGARVAGYITEPITAVVEGEVTPETIRRLIEERSHIPGAAVEAVGKTLRFFPSPGGINERVEAWLVQVAPGFERCPTPNMTPFVSAGTLRTLEVQQLLRAAQVGGLFDARLECNAYQLLLQTRQTVDAWIGAPIELSKEQVLSAPLRPVVEVLTPHGGTPWGRTSQNAFDFLEVKQSDFVEEDAQGETLAACRLEYVLPRHHSRDTLACIPVMRTPSGYAVALEHRQLPAVQEQDGTAGIVTCPAWRLPHHTMDAEDAKTFAATRLAQELQMKVVRCWELGGRYFPSPGLTPEVVYPWAFEVEPAGEPTNHLSWVSLQELVSCAADIRDGHLLVTIFRLAHALGLLPADSRSS